jgi:hypothetical protein
MLRDVLGFSARATADTLDTKPTSVDSVLRRAHKTVDARLPERNQQAALRSLGDTELHEIVDGYIWREEANVFVPREISVLTLRGTQIAGITIVRDPGALAHFGLPDAIEQ